MEAALAAGVEHVVYTSSVATLGAQMDGSVANEDTPVTIADMIAWRDDGMTMRATANCAMMGRPCR